MIAEEKEAHRAHRDMLAEYFKLHPGVIVPHETLEGLVGRNYQQRISDARLALGMNIENVKRVDATGKRLTGDYRFVPVYRDDVSGFDAYRDVSLFDISEQ